MDLTLFNSLTKSKDQFVPLSADRVTLYTCGPTVYNYAHLGNFRAYIFADILKRVLTYNKYPVLHIMNITDVDDKTIRDSQKENKTLLAFTEFYTEKFYEDRDALNILPASRYTKATDYIEDMVVLIEKLLESGHAYKSDDGSIYFKIISDQSYGQLVEITKDTLKENALDRMKADEYEKDNAQDFALWKSWDANDGDVFWETRLGKGRPGWHIECSAMAMKELGETIDIHTGGIDLLFPHHENEIAQSECATGKQFVKYWMHNGWLLVDGQKMAKSAGNFYQLKDVIEKGFDALSFRMLMLQTHYKSPLNFTWESLEAAQTARKRILRVLQTISEIDGSVSEEYNALFRGALNDDLNLPKALAVLFEVLSDDKISPESKKATILHFDTVLGLRLDERKEEFEIPSEVTQLLTERHLARSNQNWKKSDELRLQINNLGFKVEDTHFGEQTLEKL